MLAMGGGGSGGALVDLPDGVTDLFPLPAAANTCPDPPLRALVRRRSGARRPRGSVKVFDASAPGTPVASVDFAAMTVTDTIGGMAFNLQRPVYVDGNDVVVNLESRALGYGKTYFVTVDEGAITGPGDAAFSISDPEAWTFTTLAAAPSSSTALTVALDGTGDFCSPQGAWTRSRATTRPRRVISLRGPHHDR